MVEDIRRACSQKKISVVAEVYDGLFAKYINETRSGTLLTDFRLRLWAWRNASSLAPLECVRQLLASPRVLIALQNVVGASGAMRELDCERVLCQAFQMLLTSKRKAYWKKKDLAGFSKYFETWEGICSLQCEDLKVVCSVMQDMLGAKLLPSLLSKKGELCATVSTLLQKSFSAENLKEVKKLSSLCIQQVERNVFVLTMACAVVAHTLLVREKKWSEVDPSFIKTINVPDVGTFECQAAFELDPDTKAKAVRTYDSTHIFNNLRNHTLQDKLSFCRARHFRDVSDANPEILTRALVYDNLDVQNTSFSKRVFSEGVEREF